MALGWKAHLVVVQPGELLSGFVEHERRTDLSPLALAADDVTIALAGRIGELAVHEVGYGGEWVDDGDTATVAARTAEALGALPPVDAYFVSWAFENPGETDAEKAEKWARDAAGLEHGLFLEFCRARAERLVWSHVPAIAAVADALVARPILDGAAFEAIASPFMESRKEAADG